MRTHKYAQPLKTVQKGPFDVNCAAVPTVTHPPCYTLSQESFNNPKKFDNYFGKQSKPEEGRGPGGGGDGGGGGGGWGKGGDAGAAAGEGVCVFVCVCVCVCVCVSVSTCLGA